MSTIQEELIRASKYIARSEAEILLAHILGERREYVLAHPERHIGFFRKFHMHHLVSQRNHGIPVAYLTHEKEFFGLTFFVNRHVLIPRPETELLVELALKQLSAISNQQSATNNLPNAESRMPKAILVDIGTGSGCVPIAIFKNAKQKITKVFAIDRSAAALRVAKKNANHHSAPLIFLPGDLLEPLAGVEGPIILMANLPYLNEEQYAHEASIQYEPKQALVADDDGLALYKKLIKQLKDRSYTFHAFFEIDPSQTEQMKKIIVTNFPHTSVEVVKDLCGRDRVISFSS